MLLVVFALLPSQSCSMFNCERYSSFKGDTTFEGFLRFKLWTSHTNRTKCLVVVITYERMPLLSHHFYKCLVMGSLAPITNLQVQSNYFRNSVTSLIFIDLIACFPFPAAFCLRYQRWNSIKMGVVVNI